MSDKKAQLEEVATDSVQRHGFKDLSFRTLVNEVGIKSANVHYHFPNKSDLAKSLIEKYAQVFAQGLAHIDATNETVKDKLMCFIDIFDGVLRDGKLCLCGMFAAEVESLDDQGRLLLEEYFVLSEAWLKTALDTGQSELATDLTPEQLSKIILSGLEGAILLDRVSGSVSRLHSQRDLIQSFLN